MDHGVRHFHTGRKAVDDNAARLALEDWQQLARVGVIACVQVQRRGELPFQVLADGPHVGDVAAGDQQSGGPEHLLLQFGLIEQVTRLGREQRSLGGESLIARTGCGAPLAATQLPHAGYASQALHAGAVRAVDTLRQHHRRFLGGQRHPSRGLELFEVRTRDADEEAGVGAELPGTQHERIDEGLRQLVRRVGERAGQHEHRVDAAHLRVHRDRLRSRVGHAAECEPALARAGEPDCLDRGCRTRAWPISLPSPINSENTPSGRPQA